MRKFAIEIKWGIILALASFLWILLEKLMGWHEKHIEQYAFNTWFFLIPATHIYVSAIKAKRDKFLSGKINWINGFQAGLRITVMAIILNPLLQYIFIMVISPDFCKNAIDFAIKSLKMNHLEAENFFKLKNLILHSSLRMLIFGIVISSIVSIFVKKK